MVKKETYKLYRSFYEIIHPSISRKNISEYKIVFSDDIIPVQIFYPKKEVQLNRIMIYLKGNNTYNSYYEDLAFRTNQIVILIDNLVIYSKEDYFNVVHYIIEEALKCNIGSKNICIMGDFNSVNTIFYLENMLNNKKYLDIKKIVLSPNINSLEKANLKNALMLSNNEALKTSQRKDYQLIKESIYDFINDEFAVANEGIYIKIINFINGKEV